MIFSALGARLTAFREAKIAPARRALGARLVSLGERMQAEPAKPVGTDSPSPLTLERVAQELRRCDYNFDETDDGELVGLWDGNPFWFRILGDESQILQVRGAWREPVDAVSKMDLLQMVNDWNRDFLWPKAYAWPAENGTGLIVEHSITLAHGVTDLQIAVFVDLALGTGTSFFSKVAEKLPGGAEAPSEPADLARILENLEIPDTVEELLGDSDASGDSGAPGGSDAGSSPDPSGD